MHIADGVKSISLLKQQLCYIVMFDRFLFLWLTQLAYHF